MDLKSLIWAEKCEDLRIYLIIGLVFTIFSYFMTAKNPAGYGRYTDFSTNLFQSLSLDCRIAWFIQESPSFLIPFVLGLQNWPSLGRCQLILWGCFVIHYVHRVFIYSFLIRGGRRTPFLIMVFAFFFCSFNGVLQTRSIINCTEYPEDWQYSFSFRFGISMFLLGFFINIDSDRRLRNLRKNSKVSEYQIPHGGMFELVSAANYFGEILEWSGFALAAGNAAGYWFAIFTISCLGVRGQHHHRFYKEKFGKKYPKERYAVIPFIL